MLTFLQANPLSFRNLLQRKYIKFSNNYLKCFYFFFKMNKCCNRRTPTQRNQTELAPASSKAYLKEKNGVYLLQVFPLAEK